MHPLCKHLNNRQKSDECECALMKKEEIVQNQRGKPECYQSGIGFLALGWCQKDDGG